MTSAGSSGWRKGTLMEPRMKTRKSRTAKPSPRRSQRQRDFSGAGMVFLQLDPQRAGGAVGALAVAVCLADGDELRVEVVVKRRVGGQVTLEEALQLVVASLRRRQGVAGQHPAGVGVN